MSRVSSFLLLIQEKLQQRKRAKYNEGRRRQLQNKDFSLFSVNCIGGCMANDLGVRFNSPFVNLYLDPKSFLKYLKNPQYYNEQEMTFIEWKQYPIGMIEDITLYFVHYKTEEEARAAWYRRVQRIDYTNLFILFTDRDGTTYEELKEFDELPYKNKVVFTHVPHPEIKSAFYIQGFEEGECVGNLINWKPHKYGKRYYDDFDFVSWFNNGVKK